MLKPNVKLKNHFFSENPYIVKLSDFEGPLDLLLFTLKEKKVSIIDLNVAEITEQYLKYLHDFEELNLEIASEYLVMASYLIEIKSKSLLPKSILDIDQDALEEDQRSQLIARLINYEKFKKVAQQLDDFYHSRQKFLTKDQSDIAKIIPINQSLIKQPLLKIDPNLLPLAIERMLLRLRDLQPMETFIVKPKVSIADLTNTLEAKLLDYDDHTLIHLDDFMTIKSKQYYATTFLILLDFVNKQRLAIYQTDIFADIYFQKIKKELILND